MKTLPEIKELPNVDKKVTEQFKALEENLKKLGVDVKPTFSVKPALAGRPISRFASASARYNTSNHD